MNMTKESLAAILDGREYPMRTTTQEEADAKAAGLVVVFGASDDLIEFRGAIFDEGGCYNGGDFQIDAKGLLPDFEDCEDEESAADYFARKPKARNIKAIWDRGDGVSWSYETNIPHATFRVMEDGDVYCVGIVFEIASLGADA
ncbi:MAG: hypothetical protein ACK5PG_05915 [Lysobacterales bacterium]